MIVDEFEQLSILQYPHPALLRVADEVTHISEPVRRVAAEMIRLMTEHKGLGLSANQVGWPIRMFVARAEKPGGEPGVFINPTIRPLLAYGRATAMEACLSWPGHGVMVRRYVGVSMMFMQLDGTRRTRGATGLVARCWQHELDHLDGINLANPRPA